MAVFHYLQNSYCCCRIQSVAVGGAGIHHLILRHRILKQCYYRRHWHHHLYLVEALLTNSTWTTISGATASTYTTPCSNIQYMHYKSIHYPDCFQAAYTVLCQLGSGHSYAIHPWLRLGGGVAAVRRFNSYPQQQYTGGTVSTTYQWAEPVADNAAYNNICGATAASYTTPALASSLYCRVSITQTGIGLWRNHFHRFIGLRSIQDLQFPLAGANPICVGATVLFHLQVEAPGHPAHQVVATINNAGIVTGVAAGSATFVFTKFYNRLCFQCLSAITNNGKPNRYGYNNNNNNNTTICTGSTTFVPTTRHLDIQ